MVQLKIGEVPLTPERHEHIFLFLGHCQQAAHDGSRNKELHIDDPQAVRTPSEAASQRLCRSLRAFEPAIGFA
jgi:hypothetical protein